MKKIGAKSFDIIYFMNSFSLKRDFLYFDEIYYNEDTMEKNAAVGNWLSKALRGKEDSLHEWKMYEINELKEKGLLIPFIPVEITSFEECQAYQRRTDVDRMLGKMEKVDKKVRASLKGLFSKSDTHRFMGEVFDHSGEHSRLEAILLARCYNFHKGGCVPIIQSSKNYDDDPMVEQAMLINAIVEDFPYIIVTTDWAEIKSYKEDPKVRDYFSALRNWLIDVVRSGISKEELKERIAYFKSEYIKHSEFVEMKIKHAALERNVLSPLAIIENLVKGNLTEIGKTFLDRKKENIDLQIEQSNLKFQEVAYLVKANKIFDNDKSRLIKNSIRED